MTDNTKKLALLVQAAECRLNNINLAKENSFRLFHGRGKVFPGLEGCVIDIFYPVVLVTAYDDYSLEFKTTLKEWIVTTLVPLGITVVLYQYRQGAKTENSVIYGELPANFYASRNDLRYSLSFSQQNIGFFLDIEPARQWLEKHARGAKILNLFAYTCAFSVVATSCGAESVVNIDMSSRSLNTGRDNYHLNRLPTDNIHFLPHDIFKSWGKLKRLGPYDIVIIDPPSAQKGSFIEIKDYSRVWSKMEDLVAENGHILSCLNAPSVSREEFKARAQQALPGFTLASELSGSPDFPESDQNLGLKMLVFKR